MNCPLQDVCGLLDASSWHRAVLLHDVALPLPAAWGHSSLSLALACNACEFDTFQLDDGSAIGLVCTGAPSDVHVIREFWSSLLPDPLLLQLGFAVHFQCSVGSFKLTLFASKSAPSLPVHLVCIHLFRRALHLALFGLVSCGSTLVSVRFGSRTLWEGPVPLSLTGQDFMDLVSCASVWINRTMRVLHVGKQFDWRLPLSQLCPSDEVVKLSLMRPIRGGGPPGTKLSQKLQIQNSLAATLLEQGYDLHWVTQSVATVVNKVGLKELSKVLSGSSQTKFNVAKQFLQDCAIEVPKLRPQQASNHAKRAKAPLLPNPRNYRVVEGSLLNQDDTPTPYVDSFGSQLTGYHSW